VLLLRVERHPKRLLEAGLRQRSHRRLGRHRWLHTDGGQKYNKLRRVIQGFIRLFSRVFVRDYKAMIVVVRSKVEFAALRQRLSYMPCHCILVLAGVANRFLA